MCFILLPLVSDKQRDFVVLVCIPRRLFESILRVSMSEFFPIQSSSVKLITFLPGALHNGPDRPNYFSSTAHENRTLVSDLAEYILLIWNKTRFIMSQIRRSV